MLPFNPLFRNPHFQTVAAHYWRRPYDPVRFPVESRLFQTEPDVRVLVQSQRPESAPRGHVVMVHGLEGSGSAGYMRCLAQAALLAGYAAHRFHMRTCGGTERLCNTLYHAGLTSDLTTVLREFAAEGQAPAWLVGFSLGGNVVLKLAGELGDEGPSLISGVCGVSTPIDLEACARRIAMPDNTVYHGRFVRRMRERLCATGLYGPKDFEGLNTVEQIDDRITAPSFGFGTARNYYRTQSAMRFLSGIRVPALLIQSRDDTFIPFAAFESEVVRGNPRIEVLATGHGGHLGFIGRRPHRFWAIDAAIDWIGRCSANSPPAPATEQPR